jgi:hypothetical protein
MDWQNPDFCFSCNLKTTIMDLGKWQGFLVSERLIMNLNRRMRTDRSLWLILSVLAFIAFGFVSFHSEGVEAKIGPSSFWGNIASTSFWGKITQPPFWDGQLPLILAFYAIIVAIPALVFGWVAQAVVVAIRTTLARDGVFRQ